MEANERLIFLDPPVNFFKEILKQTTWASLQQDSRVSLRTLRSWRKGETSMPAIFANKWSQEFKIDLPEHQVSSLVEKRRSAGLLGGIERQKKLGNPGTPEGRRLGGQRAIQTHRKKSSSPFVPTEILIPSQSVELAELVGAILGDGTITQYQFVLYSNSLDEMEYANFLVSLIDKVFGVKSRVLYHKSINVLQVICSRALAVRYLQKIGLELGNKVKHQVDVPLWIKESPEFSDACLRGLVDTDGCVYLDRHKIKGKQYASICIAFTNASIPLLDFVEKRWKELGFSPTRFGRHVRLRRRGDVLKYAELVGFSNPKHAQKITV